MRPFYHVNATSVKAASEALRESGAVAIAGGGDLIGELKDNIFPVYPKTVVNLKTIPGLDYIKVEGDELKIGALTVLADVANSPLVNENAKAVALAALKASSPTLREMTTVGGNICQMPRCWYFRKLNNRFDCRRKGGDRCFAIDGDNRYHSICGGMKTGPNPCEAGCPAGTDIPAYMAAIRSGNMDEAADIILSANPLPMFTSRICPHPCQDGCNRGATGDPVNIHCVERSVADHIMKNRERFYPAPKAETGKKAAIVGAGPGGLAAAYYLRKAGHDVTVYDRQQKAGGVMRYGVPHYRLPKDVVDWVVDALEKMGVKFRCGIEVGRDVTVEELDEKYDGLLFCTGAWKQPILGIGGEELALFGLDFLTEVNTYLEKAVGRDVLVCGGGNVAMDVALTAKRLGAEKVTLICLEQRDEMPATEEEILRAEAEGVVIHNGWGLGSVITDENGRVTGLDSKRCVSVRNDEGRFDPQYEECERTVFPSDFIILATGQTVDLSFLGEKFIDRLKSARGLFSVDEETFRTSRRGIYAAGDAASGPNIAVSAIGGGRKAAMSMSADFGFPMAARGEEKGFVHFDPAGAAETKAAPQPERPLAERNLIDEDAGSYTAEETLREAKRCTNCACYAVNQAELAPALTALGAVIVTSEREIDAKDFFGVGVLRTTVLRPGEIVLEIKIPLRAGTKSTYRRFSYRKSIDFPIVSFAIAVDKDRHYSIWLCGAAPVPVEAVDAEALLDGKEMTAELAEQAGLAAVKSAKPFESNSYKVQLLKTLIKRELLSGFDK